MLYIFYLCIISVFFNSIYLVFRYGDAMAQTIKDLVQSKGYDKIIGAASAFGKDVLPRVGGMLDVQPISDVI